MKVRQYTLGLGIFLVVAGILGFVSAFVYPPHQTDPTMSLVPGYGRLFDLFARNALHNVIHLALGASALVAAKDASIAKRFCRFSTWLFGVLAVMGFFPVINTVWGVIPLFGHNIWLNGAIALASGFYGYYTAAALTSHSEERTGYAA